MQLTIGHRKFVIGYWKSAAAARAGRRAEDLLKLRLDVLEVEYGGYRGSGACGTGANSLAGIQARCGYGPRLPLVLVSLYARENYVDGTVLDQSSIIRFIEDNWGLGRIGGGSFDAVAGSVNAMFDFNNKRHDRLFLDTTTGQIAAIQH